jgi:hypothetical protein
LRRIDGTERLIFGLERDLFTTDTNLRVDRVRLFRLGICWMTVAAFDSSSCFVAAVFRAHGVPVRTLAIVFAFGCSLGWGQPIDQSRAAHLDPDLSLDQYLYREWSMEGGLPSDRVSDIVQTRDGYLWLATENGLARFDGLKFTVFNRANTPALATNKITTLCEGRDGTLWIGTLQGGLVRCRLGHPPEFRRFEQLEGYAIHCL